MAALNGAGWSSWPGVDGARAMDSGAATTRGASNFEAGRSVAGAELAAGRSSPPGGALASLLADYSLPETGNGELGAPFLLLLLLSVLVAAAAAASEERPRVTPTLVQCHPAQAQAAANNVLAQLRRLPRARHHRRQRARHQLVVRAAEP
ncbi:uncharacterized protein [Aegilops tauschii subsp. strangulata]|uniref:uncharacterized protein n=1 Tax=Aegilops tauschii subsp. strangulata TaxID=200361 RepID=UPI001ABC6478